VADASPLKRSLDALSSFFVGSDTVEATLGKVSELAASAVPSARMIGITLVKDGKGTTAVCTDPEIAVIDEAQYRAGTGPCLDSAKTGEIFGIASTREDQRWPQFSQACVEHGILSTVSLPLVVADRPIGAFNLYASSERAFNEPEMETATLFAAQASVVLANTQAYWDMRTLAEQLTESIESRAVIEQAKGIVMAAKNCSADEAFQVLVQQSQATNTKVRVLAEDLVRDTTRKHLDQ
jgi:GAF domain-containing protein